MFERTFHHMGDSITYTVLATSAISCFRAIVRKGMEYFDEEQRVLGSRDEIDILKSNINLPKHGDTFIYDKPLGDGLEYLIGARVSDNGFYVRHIMAVNV